MAAQPAANVLFGPTQSGKSTTFNWLTGTQSRVGDGSGESVTTEPFIQDSKIGPLVDTPGMQDSRLQFTDEVAGMKVAMAVVQAGVSSVKGILVESVAGDSMQLRKTLSSYRLAFGEHVLKSTVVLMTKADRPNDRNRLDLIRKTCAEHGIQQTVLWQNVDIDEAGRARQLRELQEALARVDATSTREIQQLEEAIIRRAVQLCREVPPRSKTIQESYTVVELKTESHPEHYVKMVEERRTHQSHVSDSWVAPVIALSQLAAQVAAASSKRGHRCGKLVDVECNGGILTTTWTRRVPVKRTRMVTRQVPRPVTKTRWRRVAVPWEPKDFLAEAKEQILTEASQRTAVGGWHRS